MTISRMWLALAVLLGGPVVAVAQVTDNFNTGSTLDAGNWTVINGAFALSSGGVVGDDAGGSNVALWSGGETFTDPACVKATYAAEATPTQAGLLVRASGTFATLDAYLLIIGTTSTPVYKFTDGELLGPIFTGSGVPVGQTAELCVSGTMPATLTININGAEDATDTDDLGAAHASGVPGLFMFLNSGDRLDNFEATTTDAGDDCPGDVTVADATELQAALDTAAADCSGVAATIWIDGATTITGQIRVPNGKTGTQYITVQTTDHVVGDSWPTSSTGLATIRTTTNGTPVLLIEPQASYWKFVGLHFTKTGTNTSGMIRCGEANDGWYSGGVQDTIGEAPHHIQFIGNFISPGATEERRGILDHCGDILIEKNWMADFVETGEDTQCVGGFNGYGNVVIRNNYCRASGENILYGGADAPTPDLVPTNFLIESNVLEKDPAWHMTGYNVKNHFEMKCGNQVTFRYNKLRYITNDEQWHSIVLTPRNQDGGAAWCEVVGVVIEYNVILDVVGCINMLGTDYTNPSERLSDVIVRHNFFRMTASYGGANECIQILGDPENVEIYNNTFDNNFGGDGTFLKIADPEDMRDASGWELYSNLFFSGGYGLIYSAEFGGVGTAALTLYPVPMYVWADNVMGGIREGYTCGDFPTGTTCLTVMELEDEFVNYGGDPYAGDYRLNGGSSYTGLGVDWDTLLAAMGEESGPNTGRHRSRARTR